MGDEVISLRVGKDIKKKMKSYEHINWSAVVRTHIIRELNRMRLIEMKKAMVAASNMDKIRKSKTFDGGKTGAEIIREWRDKRK